jgi:hypothetical protein
MELTRPTNMARVFFGIRPCANQDEVEGGCFGTQCPIQVNKNWSHAQLDLGGVLANKGDKAARSTVLPSGRRPRRHNRVWEYGEAAGGHLCCMRSLVSVPTK